MRRMIWRERVWQRLLATSSDASQIVIRVLKKRWVQTHVDDVAGLYIPCTPPIQPLYTPIHPLYTPYTPAVQPPYTPHTPPRHPLYTPYARPVHPNIWQAQP